MSTLTRYDALDDLFRGFFVRPVEFGANAEPTTIKLDVKTRDNGYLVQAELPGIKKEDIHINIDGSVVSISAEKKQEKELKEGERVLRTERHFGKVARSFDLGVDLDETQAVAKFSDGVLELTLPRKAATPQKRVLIQ